MTWFSFYTTSRTSRWSPSRDLWNLGTNHETRSISWTRRTNHSLMNQTVLSSFHSEIIISPYVWFVRIPLNWFGNESEIGNQFRIALIIPYGIKVLSILMMKILTPTVSPRFSSAFERNRKMQCVSVRNSSLNFLFRRREMMTTELLKQGTSRHVLMCDCSEVKKPWRLHIIPLDGRHVAGSEFERVLNPFSENI